MLPSKSITLALAILSLAATPGPTPPPSAANTLTAREKSEGWNLLWDGSTANGWRSAHDASFPATGWEMKDGVLSVQKTKAVEPGGGDIITTKRYADFELKLDFMLTAGANSGVKIFVRSDVMTVDPKTGQRSPAGSPIGLEFQLLDDELHPDARLGRDGNRKLGSLYDTIPAPPDKVVRPIGEWNELRIVAKGHHVEYHLNGRKTVEFDRGADAFRRAVALSKFRDVPGYGEWKDGHILLQDHGDQVFFRNIRIRELPAPEN